MAQPDPWLEQYGERKRDPRRHRRLRLALALAGVVALVVGAVALVAGRGGGWRPPSGVGGFSGCSYGGRVQARCASIDGLHVAVIPATRQPARGALFYLEGGPGGAATAAAVSVDEVFAKVSEYRDLVLVDQRGTGGSQRVACPQQHVRATDADAVASYLRRCFAHLGAAAEQLSTATAAADLERVRRSLGYGRVDIYGSSYGATLAQSYLRTYPGSVRTATLDGASLPGSPVYELAARNAERALRQLVARCAAQSACRRAFPDTRAELARVLARHPGEGDDLATTVAVLLRSPDDAVRVPLLVHEAAVGHGAPLGGSSRATWAASSTRAPACRCSGSRSAESPGRATTLPRPSEPARELSRPRVACARAAVPAGMWRRTARPTSARAIRCVGCARPVAGR